MLKRPFVPLHYTPSYLIIPTTVICHPTEASNAIVDPTERNRGCSPARIAPEPGTPVLLDEKRLMPALLLIIHPQGAHCLN